MTSYFLGAMSRRTAFLVALPPATECQGVIGKDVGTPGLMRGGR